MLIIGLNSFFQYCQPAQNQPKSHFLFQLAITIQASCPRGMPGGHPRFWKLSPSLTEEADYAHQIILAPPDFQTFLLPYNYKLEREVIFYMHFF